MKTKIAIQHITTNHKKSSGIIFPVSVSANQKLQMVNKAIALIQMLFFLQKIKTE